jgi:hypothetical protein
MFAQKQVKEAVHPIAAQPSRSQRSADSAAAAGPLAGPLRRAAGMESRFGYRATDPPHTSSEAPTELGPTADKKKSDDNGGATVPADPKQFNPTSPNTDTSGLAIRWASVEKPQKPEWNNGVDEAMASRFGGLRHQSLAELSSNLTIVPARTTMRYNRLTIGGHGNANMLATGSGDGPDVGDTLNLKESNKATWLPYFSRDKFHGRAEIWLMSCDVGNGPIPQLIADQSGSTVYAYTRGARADEKAPWD